MPKISSEAQRTAHYSHTKPPPPPPANLTEEQAGFWRAIVADLPAGHIKSDNTPLLVEMCRHLSYAAHFGEQLDEMRQAKLTGADAPGKNRRATFIGLAQAAREESRLISSISMRLRLANQARDNSVVAKRLRERTSAGRKPWELDLDEDEPTLS